MRRNLLRVLPVTSAILLFIILAALRVACQTPAAPIELTSIQLSYQIEEQTGQLKWVDTPPNKHVTIPAGALKLRFTANINRQPGDRVRVQLLLQESCFPLGVKKNFFTKLRPLTETPATEQVVSPGRQISVEVVTHCVNCPEAVCLRHCPHVDKDHLGEGPHTGSIIGSDITNVPLNESATGSDAQAGMPMHPAAFIVNFDTKCSHKSKTVRRRRMNH